MITLYLHHWSHYVEKVRWALDYKGVRWTAVEVEPFSKREMLQFTAADLTLAALLRPVMLLPFFRKHSRSSVSIPACGSCSIGPVAAAYP
jgi:glutathione S-transferase